MGQKALNGADLTQLRGEYDRKVNNALPERAQQRGDWPVHLDHCFGRVVLDNLFDGEWSQHVDGRPACVHLSAKRLKTTITIADQTFAEGRPVVEAFDRNSLRWRGEDG